MQARNTSRMPRRFGSKVTSVAFFSAFARMLKSLGGSAGTSMTLASVWGETSGSTRRSSAVTWWTILQVLEITHELTDSHKVHHCRASLTHLEVSLTHLEVSLTHLEVSLTHLVQGQSHTLGAWRSVQHKYWCDSFLYLYVHDFFV